MIGGGARFLGSTVAGQLTANIEISANAAYLFQLDKNGTEKNKGTIALGLQPSFAWDPSSDDYRVIVFSRYYYNFERVSPFLEIDLGYARKNIFSTSSPGELSSYEESFVPGGKLGGAFYVSPHVTFDAFLFYNTFYTTVNAIESQISSQNFNYNFGLGLGFQIFLQCKK